MSSRKNKNRSNRKGLNAAKGESSPANEASSDVSPSERNFDGEGIIEREFVENTESNADVSRASETFGAVAVTESAALYNDLIRSPEEPVSMASKATAETEVVEAVSDTESALPTSVEPPLEESDLFKSFFACCVGRK